MNIEQILQGARGTPFVEDKLRIIKDLRQAGERCPYVLDVVGGTGNGKSSLINTLLNEPKLVPTAFKDRRFHNWESTPSALLSKVAFSAVNNF